MPLVVAADDTTWKTLAVFCIYRLVLALLMGVGYAFFNNFLQLGIQSPSSVVPTLVTYAAVAFLLFVPARLREPSLTLQVTAGVVVDVIAIVMLMHASGGVRSGLGVILLMSLAAAGLISRGRLAFFHAAVAALAVLLEQAFQVWRHDAPIHDFLQAGLTSFALFATAALGFTLARYARTSEALAQARTIDLANLSQINELVIRDMQDGIIVVDSEGQIRQHNPRVSQLLGPLPPGRKQSIAEFAPEVARLLDDWHRGSETTYMSMRAPRGNADLQVHFVPIGTGDPPPTVIFVEDVGRARAQAQQMKLVALGRLTASIAHEIRNPLSSIGHAADLIAEGGPDRTSDERLLTIIRENVFRLDRMVQEVLYLNRRDRAQPESIDPRPWLTHFVKEFCASEKVPAESIDLQVRTSQRLWFDRQHLDQVMWNLTRNAWRHGQKKPGSVSIVVSTSVTSGLLEIAVQDDGPGVVPQARQHLFEPFFTTDAQGTGLGLYIARELCEGNGARIEYADNAPGGLFRVILKGV
ncbi:Adaptive-response sensory-kinase SasA [Usitatibacter palustris]|uniref:histidine kinase n=2 Tax=Usitatibacter palustris TaxID=2732487 RepID=A0A6M4HBS3_9PROT|nr:Adaptive-response sensory-kinase SasA [Usitatibacter palustris]